MAMQRKEKEQHHYRKTQSRMHMRALSLLWTTGSLQKTSQTRNLTPEKSSYCTVLFLKRKRHVFNC
ncbi:hypothetical protein DAI22_04g035401 [Oryza sativa Japonica Group]|nr:hypothetical protein DAI22_04g035401 [Oryza sativa Japonica Group]